MDQNLRYKTLKRILESFGLHFREGKGSETIIKDPQRTQRISCIKKHGKNPQIQRQVVAALRRKFQLDPEHGISDENFYGRA